MADAPVRYGTMEGPGEANRAQKIEVAPYLGEFFGTFVLVFTVGCLVLGNEGGAVWNPTAIASVLMAMIYAFGPVSGGNFNPAVSLALFLARKLAWNVVAGYWAAQVL